MRYCYGWTTILSICLHVFRSVVDLCVCVFVVIQWSKCRMLWKQTQKKNSSFGGRYSCACTLTCAWVCQRYLIDMTQRVVDSLVNILLSFASLIQWPLAKHIIIKYDVYAFKILHPSRTLYFYAKNIMQWIYSHSIIYRFDYK